MTTLTELISKVSTIIEDSSFSDSDITNFLNQGQLEIAGGMQSALGNWITPPLPNLFTIGTVTTATDAVYVSMPANFHRNLQFVVDSDNVEIDIANDFIQFNTDTVGMTQTNQLYEVAEFGGNLYYQGQTGTAQVLTIHYYKRPTDMSEGTDIPSCLPVHLQESLLKNYAAWKIYALKEDDVAEEGTNTQLYHVRFLSALKTLELTIPYDARAIKLYSDN